MIYATALSIRPTRIQLLRGFVLLATLAAVAIVATLAVMRLARSSEETSIGGIIVYSSSRGELAVRPNGEQAGAIDTSELALSGQGTTAGVWASPDGHTVAFVEQATDEMWMAVWGNSGVVRLSQLAGPGSPTVLFGAKAPAREDGAVPLLAAWSPGGSYLAYGSVVAGQDVLHVSKLGTSSQQSYELHDGFVGEQAWSPDGRYLAISSYSYDGKDHTVYVLDRSGGDMTRLVDGCLIVWSPDSRYLAVHRDPYDEPGLWLVSVDGVERQQLSAEAGATATAWLPD